MCAPSQCDNVTSLIGCEHTQMIRVCAFIWISKPDFRTHTMPCNNIWEQTWVIISMVFCGLELYIQPCPNITERPFDQTSVEISVGVSNYIQQFHIDVITYACHRSMVGLAHPCYDNQNWWKSVCHHYIGDEAALYPLGHTIRSDHAKPNSPARSLLVITCHRKWGCFIIMVSDANYLGHEHH